MLLSLPRRREVFALSPEEFTFFAGVEVSMRRDPSLGGTGGLEEDEEYRRWWTRRVAPSRPAEGTFCVALGRPDKGAQAAFRKDVDNMVDVGPSSWER